MKICMVVLLIACIPTANCYGNLSGPWHGGQLLVDVEGVKDIAIVREKLRIDLRPLENRDPIRITATYHIEHTLSPRELPLTFITGVQSVESVRCSVNGKPLPFTKKQVENMPESWKPPAETPGFVPDETLLYSRSITDTQHEWILFTVPLQTGRQTIEVSYEVEAGTYYSEYSTAKFWQTAYILAPARTWKSFGGLDLKVLAPEGWQVKSNLPLTNQGQQWTASVDTLPADYIALTTQHPSGKRAWVVGFRDSFYFFTCATLIMAIIHAIQRYQLYRNNEDSDNKQTCNHTSWIVFFLAFIPLAWNFLVISFASSDVPSTQNNYQLPVLFVYFQGLHWLILLAPMMLFSRFVIWLFCSLGTRLGMHYQKRHVAAKI